MKDSIFDKIEIRENYLEKSLHHLKESTNKTYIFGTGKPVQFVAQVLNKYDIPYAGVLTNQPNPDGLDIDSFMNNCKENINLIAASRSFNKKDIQNYIHKIDYLVDRSFLFGGAIITDSSFMTIELLFMHRPEIETIYNSLQDELSKRTLVAFINTKISLNPHYLNSVKSHWDQYFEDGIICFSNNEVFVDCGAYTGETTRRFVEHLNKNGIYSYDSIFSFEPNIESYAKMVEQKFPRHICINAGISNKTGKIRFHKSIFPKMSIISPKGEITIDIETIDNMLKDKNVTFIKMDIEGMELSALKGATNTIQKHHPKLAICIYHHPADLWEIPLYIKSLNQDYKLYIRAYNNDANELVLYAV